MGQLFDYRRYMNPRPSLAILVPTELEGDLSALVDEFDVGVIWRANGGFTDSINGGLTVRS